LANIISDLTKLKFQLRKKLQPATVIDGIELVCRAGCGREKVEQILTSGWASDPVHPTSHVAAKADSRKGKRSEDSGSGTGTGSHSGSGQANPRFGYHSEQSLDRSRNPRDGMQHASNYGSGSGTGYVGNRNYTPSQHSNQSRGRAGSVSSRGTTGISFSSGQGYQGFRGGGGSGSGGRGGGRGSGNRGLPRGQYWPRW
jgi:hypothetical protein